MASKPNPNPVPFSKEWLKMANDPKYSEVPGKFKPKEGEKIPFVGMGKADRILMAKNAKRAALKKKTASKKTDIPASPTH